MEAESGPVLFLPAPVSPHLAYSNEQNLFSDRSNPRLRYNRLIIADIELHSKRRVICQGILVGYFEIKMNMINILIMASLCWN